MQKLTLPELNRRASGYKPDKRKHPRRFWQWYRARQELGLPTSFRKNKKGTRK